MNLPEEDLAALEHLICNATPENREYLVACLRNAIKYTPAPPGETKETYMAKVLAHLILELKQTRDRVKELEINKELVKTKKKSKKGNKL